MQEEEIAARLGVELAIVKVGVSSMEAYRQSYSHEIVDMKVNEVVIGQLEGMQEAFADGLAAMRLLKQRGPNGEPIFAIDHNTRIRMIDAIANFADKFRPKTSQGVNINLSQQTNNANIIGVGGGRSFEARVRQIREQRGLRTIDAAGADDVIDGEMEEDERQQTPAGDPTAPADVILADGEEEEEVEPDYPEEI